MAETVTVTSEGPYDQGEPVEILVKLTRAGIAIAPTTVYLVVKGEDGSTIVDDTAGVGNFLNPSTGVYQETFQTADLAGKYTWRMYAPKTDPIPFSVQGSFYVIPDTLVH